MTVIGVAIVLYGSLATPMDRFIWNRTMSAPIGFYWVQTRVPERGDWVVVSAQSDAARWAQRHGFVGTNWPLIKQVAALEGDRICRSEKDIWINETIVATALEHDHQGRRLPVWQGCLELKKSEVLLLSPHPHSLDGRYFGVTNTEDLTGIGVPIFLMGRQER